MDSPWTLGIYGVLRELVHKYSYCKALLFLSGYAFEARAEHGFRGVGARLGKRTGVREPYQPLVAKMMLEEGVFRPRARFQSQFRLKVVRP